MGGELGEIFNVEFRFASHDKLTPASTTPRDGEGRFEASSVVSTNTTLEEQCRRAR